MRISKPLDRRSLGVIAVLLALVVVTAALNWHLVTDKPAPGYAPLSRQEAERHLAAAMQAVSDYSASAIEYLKSTDPDHWHELAMGWNWDGGIEPLAWIIRQPECDRATALLIYWESGPGWMAQYQGRDQVPSPELELYDLEMEVERRYLAGFYTRHEIAFDPRTHDGINWVNEYADTPQNRPIPQQMAEAVPGRVIAKRCIFQRVGPSCL